MSAQSYLSRGVSPTKDDVKKAVSNQSGGVFPGAFCKLIEDIAGDSKYCTAIHADGAGTKSSLAYLMYMETGDPSSFASIAQDSVVMNTDDMACVGAMDHLCLSNTIGRNAHRVNGQCIAQIIQGYERVLSRLRELGIDIIMAGGETADIGDLVRTVVVDSTIVARMKREDVINTSNIRAGNVIVGLASSGRAAYEDADNSGISSNGLTAARHMLLSKKYLEKYPESVSETIPRDKVYCGKYLLSDQLPNTCMTIGEAILSPTRTYLPILKQLLPIYRNQISGLIHCTGGGLVKCKDFGRGIRYIKDSLFEMPSIFREIYNSGEIPMKEMYQVFNCGHRMEVYCEPESAEAIIAASKSLSVDAKVVGRVEVSGSENENEVVIRDGGEEFCY